MTSLTTDPARTLPAISLDTALLILLSGAAGTVAFDLFGQALSPILGFANLAPWASPAACWARWACPTPRLTAT